MRLIVMVVVVVGLTSGTMAALTLAPHFDRAGAAPPTQAREDQITIFSQGRLPGPGTPGSDFGSLLNAGVILLALDPAEYPAGATFRFEALMANGAEGTFCARLFDVFVNTAVPGSEVCFAAAQPEARRLRSGPLALASGEHVYTIQGRDDSLGGAEVHATRIVVEWTERAR